SPASGFTRPMLTFRRTDFPLPATPIITRLAPSSTRKDTFSRATTSSKCSVTLENSKMGDGIPRLPPDVKPGKEKIQNKNQYRRGDNRLRGGPADALRAAPCGEAVVAAYQSDDKSKYKRFDQPFRKIPQLQVAVRGRPILGRCELDEEI